MNSLAQLGRLIAVTVLLAVTASAFPSRVDAVWVSGTQFQVAGQLAQIVPNNVGTTFADPTCGPQGGTSLALVPGSKLANVDQVLYPIALVVSCLDSGGVATIRARLNFINPADGKVIKQISTTTVPGIGWEHLAVRTDKGDLLGCGNDGTPYRIDYSKSTSSPDGTAVPLAKPSAATSCKGLAWEPDSDTIYQGLSAGGSKIGRVIAFKEGTTSLLADFTNLPCPANGLTISGGVLLMSCEGQLTIFRLNKNTGAVLGVHGSLTATGVAALTGSEPGLGDFACDPVTYHQDSSGSDLFTDALWSRRGDRGNGVVALEFPAFTCSMPATSLVVAQNGVSYSPLAAGLSMPGPNGPGQLPLTGCFVDGRVVDSDGDGLPDCWEIAGSIDFNGDSVPDLSLCVDVDTNGDGVTNATECADWLHKDIFVEVDYFAGRKPDPQALSQPQTPNTPKLGGGTVGVTSVREAFAAAPVPNPDLTTGIRLHLQVDPQPVTFTPLSGATTNYVKFIALTPCTDPATSASDLTQVVDFDTVKATNFGVSDLERANQQALNAKRLVFRYMIFADQLLGNAQQTCNGSGAAEVGGDDAVVTLGTLLNTRSSQAGTFMHELGHLLGLEHGGLDTVNCKPNYTSLMNYTYQFDGSPITGRRLDFSRIALPTLNEVSALNEFLGLGVADPNIAAVLNEIPPFYPAEQAAFGPTAWSVIAANSPQINWNRNKQGPNPKIENNASANINQGPTSGCDGTGTLLVGHDDWSNILYRFTAALSGAGGRPTDMPREMTKDDEAAFFAAADADGDGIGDNKNCGAFLCTHHIDIKPSFPVPKVIKLSTDGNVTVAIFSEKELNGSQVWSATQIKLDDLINFPLTFRIESFETTVKANQFGQGTCSVSDVEDPGTGKKDGIKDVKCQFPIKLPTNETPPLGLNYGVVSGYFVDTSTQEIKAFSARQEVNIQP